MWKFREVSSPWEEPCEMLDRKELGKIFYFFPSIKTPVFLGFPCGSADKKSVCNVGDLVSIPGLERSPGAGKGYPTPVLSPGEFHGLYSPWGHKELDMTKWLSLSSRLQDPHSLWNLSREMLGVVWTYLLNDLLCLFCRLLWWESMCDNT